MPFILLWCLWDSSAPGLQHLACIDGGIAAGSIAHLLLGQGAALDGQKQLVLHAKTSLYSQGPAGPVERR